MKNLKVKIIKCIDTKHTLSEKILIILTVLLMGVLVGFVTSPIKRGVNIGSYNTINTEDKKDKCLK